MTAAETDAIIAQGRKCFSDLHAYWQSLAPVINIMVVDDEPDFCDMLAEAVRALLSRRCNLTRAFSGQEALAVMENQKIDLLFLDLRMPKEHGDGLEVLAAVDRKETTVLIVTGIADDSNEIRKAKEMGCCNIIRKSDLLGDLRIVFGIKEGQNL